MDTVKYNELVNLVAEKKKILTSINEVKSFICEKDHYDKKYIRNADKSGMYINNLTESMTLEEVSKHLETFKTLLIADLNNKLDLIKKEINKFEINKI